MQAIGPTDPVLSFRALHRQAASMTSDVAKAHAFLAVSICLASILAAELLQRFNQFGLVYWAEVLRLSGPGGPVPAAKIKSIEIKLLSMFPLSILCYVKIRETMLRSPRFAGFRFISPAATAVVVPSLYLIMGIVVLPFFLVLIVPGFYVSVLVQAAAAIVFIEGISPLRAMVLSAKLMRAPAGAGDQGGMLGRGVRTGFLILVAYVIASALKEILVQVYAFLSASIGLRSIGGTTLGFDFAELVLDNLLDFLVTYYVFALLSSFLAWGMANTSLFTPYKIKEE